MESKQKSHASRHLPVTTFMAQYCLKSVCKYSNFVLEYIYDKVFTENLSNLFLTQAGGKGFPAVFWKV